MAQIGHVPPERDMDVMLAMTNPKTVGKVTLEDFLTFWKTPHVRLAKLKMSTYLLFPK